MRFRENRGVHRPPYRDLPGGAADGVFGAGDELGCLNLLTRERVAAAAALIREGRVFSLNADVGAWPNPSPASSPRTPPVHRVFELVPGLAYDDVLDGFYLQGSTQWDGFLHVVDARTGTSYNGSRTGDDGVGAWARRGIVGRSVLLDLPRWASAQGRSWDWRAPIGVGARDLAACAAWQGVEVLEGTILLLRVGWEEGYSALSVEERASFAAEEAVNPGLEPAPEVAELLWDWGVAAVACDNPALEVRPPRADVRDSLHTLLLARLGIPIGEYFLLDQLASWCAAARRYEQFFTAAPLHLVGAIGSPANAIAVV